MLLRRTIQDQRYAFLDALRAIAAMGIVLYHAIEGHHVTSLVAALPTWFGGIFAVCGLGVAIFFPLSGFVIANSVYERRLTLPSVGRFMLRRAVRLDPPYWVAIIIALAFAALSALVVKGKALPEISSGQMLAHLVYAQDVLGYRQVNTVYWTLCLEIQFYFVYVMLLCLSGNDPDKPLQGRATAAVLVVAGLVGLLWSTGIVEGTPLPGLFLPLWSTFFVGVAAYWAWRNPQATLPFLVFAAILAGAATIRSEWFVLVSTLTAVIMWGVAVSGRLATSLNWRWLQFLGIVSYSLYLTHNPITGAVFRVGDMFPGRGPLWEAFWWIVSIGACVIFAALIWWIIERPSIALARRISLSSTPSRTITSEPEPDRAGT